MANRSASPPVHASIGLLLREHARLRRLLEPVLAVEATVGDGAQSTPLASLRLLARAVTRLQSFLSAHARKEEEGLFPPIDAEEGREGGPTTNLRAAHVHMEMMLKSILQETEALRTTPDAVMRLRLKVHVHQLSQLLPEHMEEEERIVFLIARHRLPPAVLKEALARMRGTAASQT
ncbi:MAG: hemerythrin domain-containing protein [Chloroflexi bacterium]|nr:hemerythrin domain-containing protein [Chloroflexota bacterium]